MKKILFSTLFAATAWGAFAQGTGSKQALLEHFTQASCGPCASVNPGVEAYLASQPSANSLKYQTSWPGVDPMNAQNPDVSDIRRTYYNVTGVPKPVVDGDVSTTTGNYQSLITAGINNTAEAEVEVTWTWSNSTFTAIDITVTVTATNSGNDFTGADKLYVALVEENIVFASAPGSNGETSFHNVVREMVTGNAGEALGTVAAGTPLVKTYTNVAVPSYIYDVTELNVIAFVQDNSSKTVINSDAAVKAALPSGTSVVKLSAASTGTAPAGYCTYDYTPVIEVTNSGNVALTSFDLSYTLNGGTPVANNFTGSIAVGATETITFPQMTLASGNSDIEFQMGNYNGGTYDLLGNIQSPGAESYSKLSANSGGLNERMEGFESGTTSTGYVTTTPNGIFASVDVPLGGLFCAVDGPTFNYGQFGGNASSARAIRFRAYSIPENLTASYILDKTDIISGKDAISFSVAHEQYDATTDESLEVFVSTDCGTTWTSVWVKSGADLATVTTFNTASNNNPNDASNPLTWRKEMIDLSSYIGQTDLVVKFEFTSGYGNNVFLDDINFEANTVNVNEVTSIENIVAYPNPTAGDLTVEMNLIEDKAVTVSVVNTLGQTVKTMSISSLNAGFNTFTVPTADLANGVYMLNLRSGKEVTTKTFNVLR